MDMLVLAIAIGGAITLLAMIVALVARAGSGVVEPEEHGGDGARDAKGVAARKPHAAPPGATASAAAGAPMVVTQMATRGYFAIEHADGRREEAPLPDSPHGHGEFPMGLWVAPDHTLFVVGKQYTGRPGPDDGVVWRRDPSGSWSVPLRIPGRVIGHVTGRSSSEVVVGAMAGIATFDGQTWTEHSLPYTQMWKTWTEGSELVAQAFDGSVAYLVSLGMTSMTSPREEPRVDRYTFTRDGVSYRIFDRSTPIGPRTLEGAEAAQIRGELGQVQAALARGAGNAPPRDAR